MKRLLYTSCVAALLLPLAPVGTHAAITGQWDFNNTNDPFVATIGQPLQFFDPNSDTPVQTRVGTTTSLGAPGISGSEAIVMKFGTNGFGRGYLAPHGIAANGAGGMVNNWTIIMDVLFPAASNNKWRALIQTDPINPESDDAEMYINESNGLGIGGAYNGNVPAGTWVRLAFVGDLDAETPVIRKYINGMRVGQHAATLDGRFSLFPESSVALFTDGYVSDVYTQPGYINSLQIHDDALSDAYMAAIGSPVAAGIPTQVQVTPFARNIMPAAGPGASPERNFSAVIENAFSSLNTNSIRLTLNGQLVSPTLTVSSNTTTVSVTNTALLPASSTNIWRLIFSDDSTPAASVTNTIQFVVAPYQAISLPPPLYFENFESTEEGSLPNGWTNVSFTDITNPEEDLGNLDSATYARWTVVDAARFLEPFVTYSNPEALEDDYRRVLDYAPNYVVNNALVKEFAQGKFAFGNSGYRNGASQVLDLYSPDFNLTGRSAVHLAFHSIWEQNQDSIAGVEYSIDQGQTWKPVIYMIDERDILLLATTIDAIGTLTPEHSDVARYLDEDGVERGGAYGAFLKAPVDESLAPFISGRIDDNPRTSKRIEIFRLAEADNQASVRFRFFHAGTDSWYFGIDNFGLYSFLPVERPSLQISKSGNSVTITVQGSGTIQKTASLSNPDWQTVPRPAGSSSVAEPVSGSAAFYRVVSP